MVDQLEAAIGGNDIDMIGLKFLVVLHLYDRHPCAQRENVRQLAALPWIKMHDDDKGGAASLG
jgi:hypothetical protein